ncbi:MAG: LysM peptidoglycan-binding domain-containing protein [Phycisphaerae bacterium]
MTRETRIGLLVGLVFIVMFGLVLAEFVGGRGTTQNTSAAAIENNGSPLPLPVVVEEPAVSPSPTASMTDGRVAAPRDGAAAGGDVAPPPVVVVSLGGPPADSGDSTASRSGTGDMGKADGAAPPTDSRGSGDSGVETMASSSGQRIYVVEDRDSLIKIARKFYGTGHETQWKTIRDANKATLKSETSLKIGDKLIIPDLPGAKPTPAPSRGGVSSPPPPPIPPTPTAAMTAGSGDSAGRAAAGDASAARSAGRTYVVQAGDTITKIARKMYNGDDSKSAVARIMKANNIADADVGRLKIGAKLEIPI